MTLHSMALWAAIAAYAVGTVAAFGGIAWKRSTAKVVVWSTAAGLLAHTAAIAARWAEAGHFPYIEQYENVLAGSWAMIAAVLAAMVWRRRLVFAAALVLPVTLLTLGYGLTLPKDLSPVTPVYDSAWLVVHVTFAWITYAAYSLVAGLAWVSIVRDRAAKKGREPKLPAWIPAASEVDELSLRAVAFGFLNNSVMIASGAIWAYRLWGSYWSWDPVETWSLLTWLAYGLYMHAYLTLNWRGTRLAWIALFALFGVLMTFWGVQFLPTTYHLFRSMGENAPMTGMPR